MKKWIINNEVLSCYGGGLCNTRCTRPTKDRKYIKILADCITPKTTAEIYPNIKGPYLDQLRTLVYLGYMDRMTTPKYVGKPVKYSHKWWWKTTAKGKRLLKSVFS